MSREPFMRSQSHMARQSRPWPVAMALSTTEVVAYSRQIPRIKLKLCQEVQQKPSTKRVHIPDKKSKHHLQMCQLVPGTWLLTMPRRISKKSIV